MAIDTPATIAILGAGPVGIETGLYARYLGYDAMILERDDVGAHVRRWGHQRMCSSFRHISSPLGVAALRAQDTSYRPPQADAQLTGRQWIDQYLDPLSRSDLLADHILCGAVVLGVSRPHFTKTRSGADQQRERDGFCLLVEHSDGRQTWETADVVIDATGVYGQPNWCGPGGLPARGEATLRSRIEYRIPDILGTQRGDYESRRTLVIGSGLSAAATIVNLSTLMDCVPDTEVTWITRHPPATPPAGPVCLTANDQFPQRQRLAEEANRLAQADKPNLVHRPGAVVEAIDFDTAADEFLVTLSSDISPGRFDRVIANVGYRGDHSLYAELQVRLGERTESPWSMSRACNRISDATTHTASRMITTEPHFYILGAKSCGRVSSFLMSNGREQIRDLFTLIGGRAGLDLYATAEKLSLE